MDDKMISATIAEVFEEIADALETGSYGKKVRVGLTILGSEHGVEELVAAAELAMRQSGDLDVVLIGQGVESDLQLVEVEDEQEAHAKMDQLLLSGELDAAVTMHYPFPIGVSTVGMVVTPSKGTVPVAYYHLPCSSSSLTLANYVPDCVACYHLPCSSLSADSRRMRSTI